MGRKIWLNRKILPESEARVSVYDSSLMFGDMVFEMLRTFNRKTFKLDDHIDRLYASAQYTSIDMPYMKDELIQAHENLLIENRNEIEGEFRSLINVSRGILPMYERIFQEREIYEEKEMFPVPKEKEKGWPALLPGLSRSQYAALASISPNEFNSTVQIQLQELRTRISEKRQDTKKALQEVWGENLGNAPQKLQKAIINKMVVPTMSFIPPRGTWVMITCFPLQWVTPDAFKLYSEGINVVIPNQRQISAQFLEPKIKNRSRLHYKMADLQAKKIDPDAWALLLDSNGFIAEGSGSNFFIVKHRELFTPEPRNILRGISRLYVMKLANKLRVEIFQRNIESYDIYNADEAFFTNTPYCIVPVVRINGINIGNGKPGRLTKYLSFKWGEDVKYDWVAKARPIDEEN